MFTTEQYINEVSKKLSIAGGLGFSALGYTGQKSLQKDKKRQLNRMILKISQTKDPKEKTKLVNQYNRLKKSLEISPTKAAIGAGLIGLAAPTVGEKIGKTASKAVSKIIRRK